MIASLRQIALLTGKDLRIESRSRQTLGLVSVLGILIVAVLGLGLGAQNQVAAFGATAVLWVAYLFSGVLCFEKTMAVERNDGVLAALLMAPLDRGVIYLAKLLSNLVLMLAVAAIVTPVGILFFGFDLTTAPLTFAAVMSLSMLGFAAVGTLFAAVISSTRLQGGLLAMMVFPISLPLVIASTQMMLRTFRDGAGPGMTGMGILLAFDVIFLTVSWLVFEWVLEP
ncbi:heme exporter protein CcmB [Fontivita pretiosa]|uniref:heme exporter protein CcmB n=1 Tax=Fontivita pretiosa TaxID=2989684 RepID=UPI003D17E3E5